MCFPMEKGVEKKWHFLGLQCVVTRANLHDPDRWSMHRCGYVRIPAGHPWHGKSYDDIDVQVHGGLTFSVIEQCEHEDGVGYWVGFDCAHEGDAMQPDGHPERQHRGLLDGHYWELHEVQEETEQLAKQIKEAA